MKRGRSASSKLEALDKNVILAHIFPYLNAIDAARLSATCTRMRALVQTQRRFRLHLMRVAHPSEMVYPHEWAGTLRDTEAYEQLIEYGYSGEGQLFFRDATHNHVLNDFYGRHFESEHWDEFMERVQNDVEFGFNYRFIEFPTIEDGRFHLNDSVYTVHRGSCVWVSWPINELP